MSKPLAIWVERGKLHALSIFLNFLNFSPHHRPGIQEKSEKNGKSKFHLPVGVIPQRLCAIFRDGAFTRKCVHGEDEEERFSESFGRTLQLLMLLRT